MAEPGLTERGILTTGSNPNLSDFVEAIMNNREMAGYHRSSSPLCPYVFCRRCQDKEFYSGNCRLHCHDGPHVHNIQSRVILKGESDARSLQSWDTQTLASKGTEQVSR